MKILTLSSIIIAFTFFNCASDNENPTQLKIETEIQDSAQTKVKIAGAMKNVMWKGELGGIVNLDTLQNKKGLYGLGPEEFLSGEILIVDGVSYVSRVISDSTMQVEERFAAAPFFVYANENDLQEELLPDNITNMKELEDYIDSKTKEAIHPFVFKLIGRVDKALIHVQNLPKGAVVSSPEEAHQGQVNYPLGNYDVTIVGFFSTKHQAVFTHHDAFTHMHLITNDKTQMGHLDEATFSKGEMKLYLPK
jgi:acetolactate decarboxylase